MKYRVAIFLLALAPAAWAAAFAAQPANVVKDGTLVPYEVAGDAIPKPLTTQPGDAKRGEAVVQNRKLGNCLACHSLPIANAVDPGNVGPPLAGVGKMLSAGQLRLRVVDSKIIDPNTIMPSYYRLHGLHDVEKNFAGKPMLDAQQVEDVVAYLQTLK